MRRSNASIPRRIRMEADGEPRCFDIQLQYDGRLIVSPACHPKVVQSYFWYTQDRSDSNSYSGESVNDSVVAWKVGVDALLYVNWNSIICAICYISSHAIPHFCDSQLLVL